MINNLKRNAGNFNPTFLKAGTNYDCPWAGGTLQNEHQF
jgi:hypothetical protein